MKRRLDIVNNQPFPAYVVWELTLRCDQRCAHCGSRAARARPAELNEREALKVVEDLIKLKTREVILIGGEAYLHESFLVIAQALRQGGISVGLTTGAQNIDSHRARAMKEAGIDRVSVSIDGLSFTHDLLRAKKNSFSRAFEALKTMQNNNIKTTVNTTINRLNKDQLEELYEYLLNYNISAWQIQIMAPLGRGADNPNLMLQPYDLLDIIPRIAKLKTRAFNDKILIMPANNLGYFGPHEALLRSVHEDGRDYFAGCQASRFILGIESNGTIKGCPSLQTYYYAAGNVKNSSLEDLWSNSTGLLALRKNTQKELWGYCKSCDFARSCQGGCTFTAHSLFGKAGNNPYCYHRAEQLAKENKRERLVPISKAAGEPFDHGLFSCLIEDLTMK